MNTSQQTQRGAISILAALFIIFSAASGPAVAEPDPGPTVGGDNAMITSIRCPLSRIDTQYVRCDNLTGAGVEAPRWVPRR